MSITPGTLRRVSRLLGVIAEKAKHGFALAALDGAEAAHLLPLVQPRPSLAKAASARRRHQRGLSRRQRMAQIRAAVFARAGGRCECWAHTAGPPERCEGGAAVLDHWLGGIGRRRQKESVETCWALCTDCNDDRTANHPDAAWWNESFRLHCKANGLSFVPHVTNEGARVQR